MKILGENGCIVFECDSCGERLSIPTQKSKRAFMRHINSFAWKHDNECKAKKEYRENMDKSKKITNEILGKLMTVSQ